MSDQLNHLDYYRLPWNYSDNGISWLEPTTDCNLRCEGCYRHLHRDGHKSLEDVRADLEGFKKLRKSDCMSIAGGDPLVYSENRGTGKNGKGNGMETNCQYKRSGA